MFNEGDRVKIVSHSADLLVGETGTVTHDFTHIYENRTVYNVSLDRTIFLPFLKREINNCLCWPEEIMLSDVPEPKPPTPKRKWWQWGTKHKD